MSRHTARRSAVVVACLIVAACATPLPPAARVSNLPPLAGTYSGTMKESSRLARPARIVLQPDGRFEITVSDPGGFRTVGVLALQQDGALSYSYDVLKGKAAVYEGDGRRVIVLTQSDGDAIITVEKSLP